MQTASIGIVAPMDLKTIYDQPSMRSAFQSDLASGLASYFNVPVSDVAYTGVS
jgi:hypothetical protein